MGDKRWLRFKNWWDGYRDIVLILAPLLIGPVIIAAVVYHVSSAETAACDALESELKDKEIAGQLLTMDTMAYCRKCGCE